MSVARPGFRPAALPGACLSSVNKAGRGLSFGLAWLFLDLAAGLDIFDGRRVKLVVLKGRPLLLVADFSALVAVLRAPGWS